MGYNSNISHFQVGAITHLLTIYQVPGTSKYPHIIHIRLTELKK